MMASVTFSPSLASASAFSFWRIMALTSSGRKSLSPILTRTPPLGADFISNGTVPLSFWTAGSAKVWPMKRLMPKIVFLGLVTAWRLASRPTKRSPVFEIATIEGVVRAPSAFSRIFGAPASMTATAEKVVPKSMPMILAIVLN